MHSVEYFIYILVKQECNTTTINYGVALESRGSEFL